MRYPLVLLSLISGATAGLVCNHGLLRCCQATLAGDLPIVKALATLTGYPLDPRDVNCIGCM